jgi:septal ring factor EnvC (AmiA/AmiB activator)
MELAEPQMLSLISHQVELNLVHQESEIFRKSPRTTLTEQHFAVKRYFQTIVTRVRRIFLHAHSDAKNWLETALDALTQEIHEHRNLLSQQLADLKLSGRSRSMVRQRLTTLDRDCKRLEEQLKTLQKNRKALSHSVPRTSGGKVSHLRVVSSRSA